MSKYTLTTRDDCDDQRRKGLYRDIANKADGGRSPGENGSKLSAWLQLLRVPNLLTVPGDPIVGFFSWGSIRYFSPGAKAFVTIGEVAMLIPAVVSVLMLYCAGLVLNDLFDLNEDNRTRRHRPLPSGRISVTSAVAVTVTFFVIGLAAAWFNGALCAGIAGVLSLSIVSYNAGAKRIPIIGPLNMGLCRGLSVFMGLAITSSLGLGPDSTSTLLTSDKLSMLLTWPFYSITPLILYIAAISLIASRETKSVRMLIQPWLPATVVAVWMFCLAQQAIGGDSPVGGAALVIIAGLPVVMTLVAGWRLKGTPSPKTVQLAVGELIGALLLIQAAAVYFNSYWTDSRAEALPLAIALGAAYPVFIFLCRRFYAS